MSGCPFCQRGMAGVDYKDVATLRTVLKKNGAIRPRRGKLTKNGKRRGGTGLCRKHQSQLAVAVKRARFLALLPMARPPKLVDWPSQERRARSA